MAFSPYHSPTHSRTHSATSPVDSPRDRRASKSSIQTPLRSSFGHQDALDSSLFGSSTGPGGTGLGNLADELGDAFDDDDDDEYGYGEGGGGKEPAGYDDDQRESEAGGGGGPDEHLGGGPGASAPNGINGTAGEAVNGAAADGVGSTAPAPAPAAGEKCRATGSGAAPNPPSPPPRKGGHRREGSHHDGGEYGSETDLDTPGFTPNLVAKIDAVESLARRGMETNGDPADGVFGRVTDALREIGSQSCVEGSATRLITAHSALTTHLTHQIRQLHNLTFPLFSPIAPPPDPETVDAVLPLLASLSDSMPRPATTAYSSLNALHAVTADLVQTLNYLTDSLHMSRQTTTAAMRRLKTARELVAEMRREEELREEGRQFLERGNWGERLKNRECANVCGEVVGGFEEVCNGWRARLLDQAESASA